MSGEFNTIAHLVADLPEEDKVEFKGDKKSEEALRALLERLEKEEEIRRSQPTLKVSSLFGSQKSVGLISKNVKPEPRKQGSSTQ